MHSMGKFALDKTVTVLENVDLVTKVAFASAMINSNKLSVLEAVCPIII